MSYIREGDCYITTAAAMVTLTSVPVFNLRPQPSPFPQFDPKYKPYPNQGWKSPPPKGHVGQVYSSEEGTKGPYQLKLKHTPPDHVHSALGSYAVMHLDLQNHRDCSFYWTTDTVSPQDSFRFMQLS